MTWQTMVLIFDIGYYGLAAVVGLFLLVVRLIARAARAAEQNRPRRTAQEREALVLRLREIGKIDPALSHHRR